MAQHLKVTIRAIRSHPLLQRLLTVDRDDVLPQLTPQVRVELDTDAQLHSFAINHLLPLLTHR